MSFDLIVFNVFFLSVSCNGGIDGFIMLMFLGGVGGYIFFWLDFNEIIVIVLGLMVGVYNVIVIDVNGCE